MSGYSWGAGMCQSSESVFDNLRVSWEESFYDMPECGGDSAPHGRHEGAQPYDVSVAATSDAAFSVDGRLVHPAPHVAVDVRAVQTESKASHEEPTEPGNRFHYVYPKSNDS
jgi:hypothetical protein